MTETQIIQNKENSNLNTNLKDNLIKITGVENTRTLIKVSGILTSQTQLRGEGTKEPYYYAFVRLKGQNVDLPVIFKIKEDDKLTKPNLKKSDEAELTGHYSNSPQSVRKSFTCSAYQLLNEMQSIVGDQKRIRKKCVGCCDNFTCSQSKNYDYCSKCKLNGSRYIQKDSPCSECDGSGLIKFPNQPPRACKLCYLAHQEQREESIFK